MTSYRIPRRTFLRGSGVAMALPMLEIMGRGVSGCAAKEGAARPPLRFCVLYKGCGVNPNTWDVVGGSEDKFDLPQLLRPLERHHQDITILRGIDSDHRANGTHVQATLSFMTGDIKKSNYRQAYSFDQAIADIVGRTTPVRSLVLRGDPYIDKNDSSENYLSYDKDGDPLPVDANPEVVFNRLFKGFNNARYRDETTSILDRVRDSYQAVFRKASRQDRQTLQHYLDAVRDVEREIDQFDTNTDPRRQERLAQVGTFTAGHNMGERVRAMLDLIAIAFWTNTTRVASLIMAHTESRGLYDFIGINEEFHYLSHFVRNKKVIPHFDAVNVWHTEQFAYFLDKLKSFRDGPGTVFDNSVVLFGSGLKHSDYHSVADLPLVLSGGGGGQIKLGRYVRYDHEPNGNLLLKLMDMMGAHHDTFGNGKKPIAGITERGTFHPEAVDDGTWRIVQTTDKQLTVRGLLKVRVLADDPNVYLVQLSNGEHVEIRTDFGNINSNRMDLYVGSVMTVVGEFREDNGRPVITKVGRYEVHK